MVIGADNVPFRATQSGLLAATRAAIQSGRLARAHGLLLAATVLEPENFEAWLLLGWTSPDPTTAVTCFQRALALDPGNILAKDGLAWAVEHTPGAQAFPARDVNGIQPEVAIPIHDDPGTADVAGEPVDLPAGHPEIRLRDGVRIGDAYSEQRNLPLDQLANPMHDGLRTADAAVYLRPVTVAHARTQRLSLNRNLIMPLAYLLAFTLAEVLATLVLPQVGLVLYSLLLVTLPVYAVLAPRGPLQRLPLTLVFPPLIRLLSLSLPLANFPFIYWYLVVGAPLFIAGFVAIRVLGYPRAKIGLTLGAKPMQFVVGLSGIGVGCVEYLILRPLPLIKALTWEQVWWPALILLIFTGFLEEFLFRGLMQRAATDSLGRVGVLYVAILFAVLHAGYHSILDVAFVFVIGVYFAWVVARTGSIIGVTLAHGLANIGLFLVFPFLLG